MASTISEEKVVEIEDNAPKKKQVIEDAKRGADERVLEEIAAKVDDLNVNQHDHLTLNSAEMQGAEEIDYPRKLQEQGALINSLVNQLRAIIDEYRDVCQEKDRYEELSEALLQSLELEDLCRRGAISQPTESVQPQETARQDDSSSRDEDDLKKCEASASGTPDEADNATTTSETGASNNDSATTTAPAPITKEDLIRINAVLLREIYDLRHKIEDIHEIIAEFFDCTEDSEYDTADELVEDAKMAAAEGGDK